MNKPPSGWRRLFAAMRWSLAKLRGAYWDKAFFWRENWRLIAKKEINLTTTHPHSLTKTIAVPFTVQLS